LFGVLEQGKGLGLGFEGRIRVQDGGLGVNVNGQDYARPRSQQKQHWHGTAHTRMHAPPHTHMHTHTRMHTHIQTHTHTHIQTHTHTHLETGKVDEVAGRKRMVGGVTENAAGGAGGHGLSGGPAAEGVRVGLVEV
jgi:hypothetical protein